MKKIYLDNNATTPLDPLVTLAMEQEIHSSFGNPSSIHSFGLETRTRLTKWRRSMAERLGVFPQEIVFTSGGTEALNLLIHGHLEEGKKGHVITSNVEHACVFQAIQNLEKKGYSASFLAPGNWGSVRPEQVEQAISKETALITLMAVNNETGVMTDVEAIAEIARKAKIPFIVDGVALLGKESFSIPEGVSGIGFSAHKFHGPKGVGFAYVRSGLLKQTLTHGGGQENNLRSGTENLIGIAGLAKAFEIAFDSMEESSKQMHLMRILLEKGVVEQLGDVKVMGDGPKASNTSTLSFSGVDGESLLMNLDLAGIAVSHGSACSSGALEPSRVLLNMGIDRKIVDTSVRFSLSRMNTDQEVEEAIGRVVNEVQKLRSLSR